MEEAQKKILAEIDTQMVRLLGFQDGYKAAMEYVVKLLKEPIKDGTGIPADSGNTSSPS